MATGARDISHGEPRSVDLLSVTRIIVPGGFAKVQVLLANRHFMYLTVRQPKEATKLLEFCPGHRYFSACTSFLNVAAGR